MRFRASIIALLTVLSLSLAAPVAQAQEAPGASTAPAAQTQETTQAEGLSAVPEVRAGQHVERIPYDTSFYRFRVYGGGMNCQANVRFFVNSSGEQVTTMKMVGAECFRERIRVSYGGSYSPPEESFVEGHKLRISTPVDFPFHSVLYGLCVVHTDSQERVCSLLERAPASAGQPVSINSSSLPEGGGGLFRLLGEYIGALNMV